MLLLNMQHKKDIALFVTGTSWGVLGFRRGLNSYDYNYKCKTIHKESYLYSSKGLQGYWELFYIWIQFCYPSICIRNVQIWGEYERLRRREKNRLLQYILIITFVESVRPIPLNIPPSYFQRATVREFAPTHRLKTIPHIKRVHAMIYEHAFHLLVSNLETSRVNLHRLHWPDLECHTDKHTSKIHDERFDSMRFVWHNDQSWWHSYASIGIHKHPFHRIRAICLYR